MSGFGPLIQWLNTVRILVRLAPTPGTQHNISTTLKSLGNLTVRAPVYSRQGVEYFFKALASLFIPSLFMRFLS
jgi:hypothetical protein